MSGSEDLYIAIIRGAACGGICGLGGGMTALFFAADGPEASHEIGHGLGRLHTPCDKANAPDADKTYPVYNGFPRGSIGEVGFDLSRDKLFNPQTTYDFMSYCSPTWVSPWTYLHLWNEIVSATGGSGGGGQGGPGPPPPLDAGSEFYYVAFRIYRAGTGPRKVEIANAFHLARGAPRSPGAGSGVMMELLGPGGVLILAQPAEAMDAHTDEGALFVGYRTQFPAHSELRAVRVVANGVELAEWPLASDPPIVGVVEARTDRERLFVRWSAEADVDAVPPLSFGVRYSADGKRWRPLAAGITSTELACNLGLLPGGDACRVQIVASAGLRTTVAESNPFAVTKKVRSPTISSPTHDAEYEVGAAIPLVGAACSPDWGATCPDEVSWSTPAVGVLGVGHQVTLTDLPVGRHRIVMHASDGAGGEVLASVPIRVVPKRSCEGLHGSPSSEGSSSKAPCRG